MPESIEVTRSDSDFVNDIWRLKTNNILCDTIVKVNAHEIPVHAVILAATNEYFEKILDDEINTTKPKEIVFNDFDQFFIESLIEFCYKGTLELTNANAIDLMIMNKRMKIKEIEDKCGKFLEKILTDDNCLAISYLAEGNVKKMAEAKLKSKNLDYIHNSTRDLKEMRAADLERIISLLDTTKLADDSNDPKIKQILDKWDEMHEDDPDGHIANLYKTYKITDIPNKYKFRI